MRRGLHWGCGLLAPVLLSACFSIGAGSEAGPQLHRQLVDAGAETVRRAQPLVDALLIQPLPADALARGVAAAVGLLGEPLRADWLLTLAVDTLHHDVSVPPGQARLAVTVELFDRRNPARVARRSFTAGVPTARADSAAAAVALSQAVAAVFDAMLPWLEEELQRATAKSGP